MESKTLDEETIVNSIRAERASGRPSRFEDQDFAANDTSLYTDIRSIPEYAQVEPRASSGPHPWLYPSQISDSAKVVEGGVSAADVIQGQLGDCWFLGALAAVASHKDDLVENLLLTPEEDVRDCGVFSAQFYKDGEWRVVTTDARIPWGDPSSDAYNMPIYGRCGSNNELWVPLLEKCFAKLHGTYQALNGGSVAEALVDLTGGACQKFLLTDEKVKAMVDDDRLWLKVKRNLAKGNLFGCSMSKKDGGFEQDSGSGILTNHAYSIMHVKEVGKGLRLVKVRNPWGHGEWRGDWSDSWVGWSEHPDVEAVLVDDPECGFRRGDDGVFWMVWEDFVRYFNKIYFCRLFRDEFMQIAVSGRWEGLSAAGAHKLIIDRDGKEDAEAKASEKGSKQTVMDGDAGWFHNPQYRLTCTTPSKCFISLMQGDSKIRGRKGNAMIRFTVIKKRKGHKGRVWEEDPSEIVADTSTQNFANRFPQREVCCSNIKLDPKYAYIIVPHTVQGGVVGDFLLRVFSKSDLVLNPIDDPFMATSSGRWGRSTSGGPRRVDSRDNPTWSINPQYWIRLGGEDHDDWNESGIFGGGGGGGGSGMGTGTLSRTQRSLPRQITLKIVLRRTDRHVGRDDKSDGTKNRVGLDVTRVPVAPIVATRRKLGTARTNALGETLPVKESSLKRPLDMSTADPLAEEDGKDEEEQPPKVRLEIKSNEFCQTSDYHDAAVATTKLVVSPEWFKAGLIVHPSMRLQGREGDFDLSVFASVPVAMSELARSGHKALPGSWQKGKTAHGCHLHPEWKRNPAFEIKLPRDTMDSVSARITLSRPEELWKGPARMDSVGCMIGFYVVTCDIGRDAKLCDGRAGLLGETSFVPMHSVDLSVTLPAHLAMTKSFLVIPATFEPGKEGPFHISVTCDSDFTLTQHK